MDESNTLLYICSIVTSLCTREGTAPLSLKQNRGESLSFRCCLSEGDGMGQLNKGYIVTNCHCDLFTAKRKKS